MNRKLISMLLVAMLILCMVSLAACESPIELDAPSNIRYDGKTITWNAVENADSYTVSIDDGEAYPVTSNKFPYNAKGQSFTVKITAVSNLKKIVSSGEAMMVFFPLDTIETFNIDSDGTLSWNAVENADSYEISVDGEMVDTVSTLTYKGVPAGTHTVQIRPVVQNDYSYYSAWSTAKSMTVLDTVDKDSITYSNGCIRWKYVTGAQYYEVRVNGNVVSAKNSSSEFMYDADNMDFEVSVKPLGNGANTFDGVLCEGKKFVFLDTVTNVRVEDGILRWDAVAGADAYDLELNGVVHKNMTQTYFDKLAAGVDTSVRVMPISNDSTYFSDWSALKIVRILESPQIKWNASLELDGEANNSVYWDLVSNATGYQVRLTLPSGEQIISTYGETQKSFADAYLYTGAYTVEVKALAPSDTSDINDSAYSQPIYVTRLASPERADNNFIVSNPVKVTDGFTVTFKGVSGATQYKLYQDNILVQNSTGHQFTVTDLINGGTMEAQTYNFKIQSVGNVETVNGRTYVHLSSLTSEALAFQISILAMPTNPSISGYNYTFGEVSGNYGYAVNIGGNANSCSGTSYSLETLAVGNFSISVCTRGNGSDVLPSNYTAATTVYRLAAPNNIRILTSDASEGVLSYDQVQYASGYEIIFDNSENAIPVTNMMNINQYITEQGTTVCMQAVANYYNVDHTIYYMTSPRGATVNFVKLAAPTFGDLAFSNTQLLWKAPENINAAVYTPTYEVYYADGTKYNGEKNGTSMDISNLEGGMAYTFYVKAIGNGTSYINSEKSVAVSIYKLGSPKVNRENGQYCWNGVINASGYVVYVDGVEVAHFTHESGQSYSYTPKFDEITTYRVEVIAIGDQGYTTVDSKPTLIEQIVKQLETPEFTFSYSNANGYSTSGTIDVTITKQSPYAKGYAYTVGGATVELVGQTAYSHLPSSVGKYTVSVYALGGNFDEQGVFYINSQRQGGNSSYEMVILDITNVSSITMTRDGYLDWADSSLGATLGYTVKVSIDGGEWVEYANVRSSGLAIEGLKPGATVAVKIQANGNGRTIIASEVVEWSITLAY